METYRREYGERSPELNQQVELQELQKEEVAAIVAGAMLAFTIFFSRGKSKSLRITESVSHV